MQRKAFTLVELLVVIAILALLASMMLFALAGAEGDAKVMRTRSTILKLHNIVMQKWESYQTRRVPINPRNIAAYRKTLPSSNPWHITPATPYTAAFGMARIDAVRELMRMELPDSFTDITDPPLSGIPVPSTATNYRRKIASANGNFISAKCLYLIVVAGDPEILEQFSPSEIATDDDGLKYFQDAWQKPIYWLRWAPAFASDIQRPVTDSTDPLDPLKIYTKLSNKPTWPLYPLIYSAGPDGDYDISAGPSSVLHYRDIVNNPFHDTVRDLIGKRDEDGDGNDGSLDNITNHGG